MILGEVPTRVINPPSREPNDMGIRNTDGDARDFRAILSADGIRMASAPIFLTSADRTVTEDTNMGSCQRTRVTDDVRRASLDSMIPDRATAELRTSELTIMMRMSSLNTEKASFAGAVHARIDTTN